MMLRLNRSLDVVTDHASAARHHRMCVGISKRNLFVRGGLQLNFDIPEFLHLQGGNLAVQTLGFGPCHSRLLPVGSVQRSEVAADAGFDLLHSPLQLGTGEVAVANVDRLELAAVDCHQRFGEQTELLAQHHELPADTTNGFAVVLAEVGDGLEVRHQASGQPHQLDVALCFTFEAATRLDAVEVTVDTDLQQDGRVIRRAASFGGNHAAETQPPEIEFIDEHIDYSHRIGVRDVIIQSLGQQCALASMLALDETLHGLSPL